MLRTTILILAALAAVTVASAAATPAEARERRVQAAAQTPRGERVGVAETRRQRGERTRRATVSGPNGETSVEDTRRRNLREGTASHDRTRVFPNGDARTVDADAVRTAPGEWDASRTVTGRNGETRTQTGSFAAERTETGRVVTGDVQTQNHGQVDTRREVTRGSDGRAVTSSATFEDGTSVSRASLGSCDGAGNCTRQTDVVGRNGAGASIAESRARTETGAVYSRDATFADGTTRAVDVERDGNGDGTGAVTRTVTGRNGETRTQSGTYEVSREP